MLEVLWQSDDGSRSLERTDKGVFFVWRTPIEEIADRLTHPDDFALTKREHQIFNLIIEGLSDKQIAEKSNLSVRTVKFHNSSIYRKMNVPGRLELIRQRHQLQKAET